jgi:hypothetical protein
MPATGEDAEAGRDEEDRRFLYELQAAPGSICLTRAAAFQWPRRERSPNTVAAIE